VFLRPSCASIVVDQKTLKILAANEAAAKRYGYSRPELLSMKISDLRVPDERHLVGPVTDGMAQGASVLGPFRHVTAGGELVRTEVVSIPIEFDGRPAIAAVLLDETHGASAEARAQLLFDRLPLAAWIHDSDTLEILAVNDAAVTMYGYSREELLRMRVSDVRPDHDSEATRNLMRRYAGQEIDRVYRHRRKDGTIIDIQAKSIPIPYGSRNVRLGVGRDITEQLIAEETLQRAKENLEEAQELTHLGSWHYDFASRLIVRSKELRRILGLHEETGAIETGDVNDYVHAGDLAAFRNAIESAATGDVFTVEHRVVRPDGAVRWVSTRGRVQRDSDGALLSATGTVLDITEEKLRGERLQFFAYHDPLTGLPNRQSIDSSITRAMRDGRAAVLFIDFDSFKEINDSFGHTVGDALLRQIAARLVAAIGNAEICRWGGDEFIVVTPLVEETSYQGFVDRVRAAIQPSFKHEGRDFFITPSIGIALYPDHGTSADELIRNADTAMYDAKKTKNSSQLFRPSMLNAARHRLYVQNGLHEALLAKQFSLVFQPIISAETGSVVSAEALIRWRDPAGIFRSPGDFIEIAEQTGLILPIGDWVVHEAARVSCALNGRGIPLPIAINVASQQLEAHYIIESIAQAAQAHNLQPGALQIEITESGIMRDVERSIDVMQTLRKMGVRIALDDFGAGYSSLSHLKLLPLDAMKIDRSLVMGLGDSEQDRQIITAVLQLAKATRLFPVAEGVETAAQAQVLTELGCGALQGKYFSAPLHEPELFEFLTQRTR
jgi:diguanylate cyclase (GGDEF)-like protein/PAS domain S-box-containing protein